MRQTLRAAAFALMAGMTLAPAHAADILYAPPRANPPPPPAYPEPYPYPAPYYPGYGWVTYLPAGYGPPLPPPAAWEVFPNCCPDPYYPYIPSFP
ncbi:hypothetical protein [Methyloferula stellata]|uniref:hypothetical protein n=1 Tax=Methyloferula stellata TaxID=876270 RepID=UPI0003751B04|nr:hypothetical protein [Methyloferula stellata]